MVNNKPTFIQRQRQRNFHNQIKFTSTRVTQNELTDRLFRLLCEVVFFFFKQSIGIPIGNNCAPLLSDFIYFV